MEFSEIILKAEGGMEKHNKNGRLLYAIGFLTKIFVVVILTVSYKRTSKKLKGKSYDQFSPLHSSKHYSTQTK